MALADSDLAYYDQSALWVGDHGDYDAVLEAVLRLLPSDAATLLDVGCGNGTILNRLPRQLQTFGADVSRTGLSHVETSVAAADACSLPFPDQCFDIVISTDTLEHLPDRQRIEAVNEMVRVARRYVLIVVPHQEPLASFLMTCTACGATFHAHHHHRAFDHNDLVSIVDGSRIRSEAVGARWLHHHRPLVEAMRALTRSSYVYAASMCPHCGNTRQPPASSAGQARVERQFESLQYLLAESDIVTGPVPSEVAVLFGVHGQPLESPVGEHDPAPWRAPEPQCWTWQSDTGLRRERLENYPVEPYVVVDGADYVLVVPTKPSEVVVTADHDVTVSVFDPVNERYIPAQMVRPHHFVVESAVPSGCGYRLRISSGQSGHMTVHVTTIRLQMHYADAIDAVFNDVVVDDAERRRADENAARVADLYDRLQESATRADLNARRVDELYDEVQAWANQAAQLNEKLNQLEAKRQRLEHQLHTGGRTTR
jgi:SAM-dependent methyltransferase